MKILVMAGTRPEAIKLSPVIHELRKYKEITTVVCNTGQHREMIKQAFDDFNIVPDLHLDIMTEKQTLSSLSARLFEKIEDTFKKESPDWILVQGDTTTVMVSAMCAFYRDIRIGHIEAGLRSFNKWAPFPEEINREIVSKIADLHFAPTKIAYANLIREGIEPDAVFVTGNTVIDALYWIQAKIEGQEAHLLDPRILKAKQEGKRIVLVTGHRRENFGHSFIEICQAIQELANLYTDVVFVYPVHLNPQVQQPVMEILGDHPRIILLSPLSYMPFMALLKNAYMVLTDSGGIQEEAPALGKPVLVMRDVTERPEGVKAGVSKLVGPHKEAIVEHAVRLLNDEKAYMGMAHAENPYGDGHASARIIDALLNL